MSKSKIELELLDAQDVVEQLLEERYSKTGRSNILRDLEKHLDQRMRQILHDHVDSVLRIEEYNKAHAGASAGAVLMILTGEFIALATNMPAEMASNELAKFITKVRNRMQKKAASRKAQK